MSKEMVGVPPAMLSGIMAAETIEHAIRKNDFGAKTLKQYLKYLDKTAMLDALRQAAKVNKYVVKKGLKTFPVYNRTALKMYKEYMVDTGNFLIKDRYSYMGEIYSGVIRDFITGVIRTPLESIGRAVKKTSAMIKKVK